MTTTITPCPQGAIVPSGTTMAEFELCCGMLVEIQRDILWQIGDVALALERQHPQTHNQAWPVWVSPDLISRCKAVSAAYAPEERNIDATWTVHMQNSKQVDRIARVQASVDAGQTSDEARKHPAPVVPAVVEESPAVTQPIAAPAAEPEPEAAPERIKWLLAVDVSYFVCSTFFSGAGVEAASQFDGWLSRRLASLHKDKGLTDVVCCLDSPDSFRKRLTETWKHPYKLRVAKEDELRDQLRLAGELLRKRNLLCVSVEGMEADDVMASYASQFDGRITLLTKDKDLRQCLSSKCNMLTKIDWETHPDTGKAMPVYQWVTAATHFTDGVSYNSSHVDGITPEQWPHFQALAGDPGDNVKGAIGIGPKVAVELIREHHTVQAVIAACKDGRADVTEKKRLAILDFEAEADVTLQLVTMLTNLPVPSNTTYAMIENIDSKEPTAS